MEQRQRSRLLRSAPTILWVSVGLGCVASGMLYWVKSAGSNRGETHRHAQRLSLGPDTIDLGTFWVQDVRDVPVRLVNTSDTPVVIAGFDTSCGCVTVTPSDLTLMPSAPAEVRVSIRPDRAVMKSAGPRSFTLEATLTPRLGGRGAGAHEVNRIVVKGLAVRPTDLPRVIDCGDYSDHTVPLQAHNVVFTADERVRTIDVVPAHGLSAAVTPVGPARYQLSIGPAFAPAEQELKRSLSLRLTTDSGDVVHEALSVRYRVVRDLQLFPATLTLGGHQLGSKITQRLNAASLSGRPVTAVRLLSKPDNISASQVVGRPTALDLTVTIEYPGSNSQRLQVAISTDSESAAVPLTVSYTGVP